MIGSKIIVSKEIRTQYSLLNVRHGKLVRERLVAYLNSIYRGSEAFNGSPVGCSEAGSIGALESLGVGWRDN